MGLERVGVEFVADNFPGFNRALQLADRAVAETGDSIKQASAKTDTLNKSMAEGGKVASALGSVMSGALTVGAVAAAAAIAGVGVAIGGVVALMQRGAGMDGIIGSFDILKTSIVGATDTLGELQKGAAGTISDMELMKKANMALMGMDEQVAQMFANTMPKLLEIARVQAGATGQSVTEVFDALIMAVKEAQPRLLNHAGIVIKSNLALDRYAASIGKTASELNLEEQQMATLNAVMQAGGGILARYGGLAESADEKLARLGATATNAIDKLAVAVQPAFKRILDALQPIFNFLQRLATAAAPYLAAIANLFASLVEKILGPIGKGLKALSAEKVVKGFFEGGARIIGALAGGMASAANEVIKVVTMLAKIVASFLSGFSPPPEGPLSTIDIGGANVMKAWLQGFLGVSLDPISRVAADVSSMMGSIATMSRDQVESRLSALDTALQPFQDRLDLVKASFEALKPVTDAAFSAIDRQMEKALIALNKGEAGSGAMVRQLDNQRMALQDYVDTQQAQIDAAQIQLSLTQAQQAQERAALAIRQRQLGPASETRAGAEGTTATGGSAATPADVAKTVEAPMAALQDNLTSASDTLDTFSLDVSKAMDNMKSAFNAGFTGAGGNIKELETNFAGLQKTWDDLSGKVGGLVEKVKAAFANLPTWFTDTLVPNLQSAWDIIKTNAETKWTEICTSIETAWTNLGLDIGTALWNIKYNIMMAWFNIQTAVETAWTNLRTAAEAKWEEIRTAVSKAWTNLQLDIGTALWNIKFKVMMAWFDIQNWFSAHASELAAAITGILQPILNLINNIRQGLAVGGGGNPLLGGLLGPLGTLLGHDYPGPYAANQPYVVGTGAQPELFMSQSSGFAIPNIDRVLASVGSIFAQPAPMYAGAGSYSYDNSRHWDNSQQTINLNGVSGTSDSIRRYALLRAVGRVR